MSHKFNTKYFYIVFFTLAIPHFQGIQSQTKNTSSIYNWFDEQVNIENLQITNGKLSFNPYSNTLNNENRFLSSELFTIGEIIYENQYYGNQELNYDIYSDELYLKPKSLNNKITLVLNTKSIKEFVVENKKFINIEFITTLDNAELTGFYEEYFKEKQITQYIKHKKSIFEKFIDRKVYYEFEKSKSYLIYYKDSFYEFNTKKDVKKVFTKLKSKINTFYSENYLLEKEDKSLFTKTLIIHLMAIPQEN